MEVAVAPEIFGVDGDYGPGETLLDRSCWIFEFDVVYEGGVVLEGEDVLVGGDLLVEIPELEDFRTKVFHPFFDPAAASVIDQVVA